MHCYSSSCYTKFLGIKVQTDRKGGSRTGMSTPTTEMLGGVCGVRHWYHEVGILWVDFCHPIALSEVVFQHVNTFHLEVDCCHRGIQTLQIDYVSYHIFLRDRK